MGRTSLARHALLVGALFAAAWPSTAAAAACAAKNVQVTSDKIDYQVGDTALVNVYVDTEGDCGVVKTELWIKGLSSQTNAKIATVDECPKENLCEVLGATYHSAITAKFKEGYGTVYLEARAYNNGALLAKSADSVRVTIGTPGGAAPPPPAAPPERRPLEVELAYRIGGLTRTVDIAKYLAAVYTYALGIVTTLAVSMIVYGGIKYLTAGADQGRIKQAKETISNAFVGLLLALGTFLILNTINPALVNLKPLVVEQVQKVAFQAQNWCELLNPQLFTVDPGPPQDCGVAGKVSAKQAGTKVLNESCTYRLCDFPLACAPDASGKLACRNCTAMGDDDLMKLRASVVFGDTDCAPFSPNVYNKARTSVCVYTNDLGRSLLEGAPPGCGLIDVYCANIKSCEDYGKANLVVTEDHRIPLAEEFRCLIRAGNVCGKPIPAPHMEVVCNASDPCGVGPCKAELTKAGQAISEESVKAWRTSREEYKKCVKA